MKKKQQQQHQQKQKQKMEKIKFWWRNDGFLFVPEVKVITLLI